MGVISKFLRNISITKKLVDYRYNAQAWNYYKPFTKKIMPPLSPPKKVLVYPNKLWKSNPLYLILHTLDYQITYNPDDNYDLVIQRADITYKQAEPVLLDIAKTKKVINIGCKDISKETVVKLFTEIFGYGMEIDPLTYQGKALRKGNDNFRKDGIEINCPIPKKEDGYVYQKIINTIVDENYVEDFRVPVFGNNIPCVYRKLISLKRRFSDITEKAFLMETKEVFSEEEIQKILQLCQAMGVEYGELDVLRNKDDGKIYVVDVNDTPGAPPGHKRLLEDNDVFGEGERQMAMQKMAIAFHEQFIKN